MLGRAQLSPHERAKGKATQGPKMNLKFFFKIQALKRKVLKAWNK